MPYIAHYCNSYLVISTLPSADMQTAAVSLPSSESAWRKALAAVHPDKTGDAEPFRDLVKARDRWRKSQPKLCLRCGKGFEPRRPTQKHCNAYCARVAAAASKKRPLHLKQPERTRRKGGRPRKRQVDPAILAVHARHAKTFGFFSRCQHTTCKRARLQKGSA